jgi:hypothetical protein
MVAMGHASFQVSRLVLPLFILFFTRGTFAIGLFELLVEHSSF